MIMVMVRSQHGCQWMEGRWPAVRRSSQIVCSNGVSVAWNDNQASQRATGAAHCPSTACEHGGWVQALWHSRQLSRTQGSATTRSNRLEPLRIEMPGRSICQCPCCQIIALRALRESAVGSQSVRGDSVRKKLLYRGSFSSVYLM